ncbi:MAG: hypothetical protein WD646_00210 [Actinomycetota bacterium]
MGAPARPDLAAYDESVRMDAQVLIKELRDLLGARLVAYMASVKETRAVHEWAEGERRVRGNDVVNRLRVAYQVARLITVRDEPDVAQAWLQGLNPKLGDRPPARLLRDGDLEEVGPEVLAAARDFAAVG